MKKKIIQQDEIFETPFSESREPHPALSLVCKGAVVALFTLGLVLMLCDAFGFPLRPAYFAACIIPAAVFALISYSGKCALVGSAGIAAVIIAFALKTGEPIKRCMLALDALIAALVERLTAAGFNAFAPFELNLSELDKNPARDLAFAVVLIAILISGFVSLFALGRVRLTPILLLSVLLCGYVFIYDLGASSLPIAIIVSGGAGIAVLRICDARANRGSVESSAGFASFAAALAAALAVALPASIIKAPAPPIPVIDDGMQIARILVTSVIMGDLPSIMELGFAGYLDTLRDRDTEASDRNYSGEILMTVEAGLPMPVYLRSWVGTDYGENSWSSGNINRAEDFRKTFGEDFTPEMITTDFYDLIDPTLLRFTSISSSRDRTEHGFVSTFVDITTEDTASNLLALPSLYNAGRGLLMPGQEEAEYDKKTTSYYDGIHTTERLNFRRSYRALAHLPTYSSPVFLETFLRDFNSHAVLKNIAARYYTLDESNRTMVRLTSQDRLAELGLESAAARLISQLDAMSKEELDAWYHRNITLPELYSEYVKEHYLSVGDEGSWLDEIVYEAIMGVDFTSTSYSISEAYDTYNIEFQHKLVMKVLGYLRENYTYSLTPKRPEREDYSALRAFLCDTKEGYCVQYATSAIMLLRKLGIPARYVEGYIADDFEYNHNADSRKNYYISPVYDYSAHAWLEVYYEGYGWMTYEATPPYMHGMYEEGVGVGGGVVQTTPARPATPVETPETLPELEEDDEEDEETGIAVDPAAVIAVIVITIAAFAVIVIIKRGNESSTSRDSLLSRTLAGLPEDEISRSADCALDTVLASLGALGIVRGRGTLPLEFAEGVDKNEALAEFDGGITARAAFEIIEREQFGGGIDADSARVLCDYAEALRRFAYKKLSLPQKIYLRFVKRTL